MSTNSEAFTNKIPEGLVRLLLRIQSVDCKVENNAPDFVEVEKDQPLLKVSTRTEIGDELEAFQNEYPMVMDQRNSNEDITRFKLEEQNLWFDIPMEEVKDYWIEDFSFYLSSQNPRYLSYYIREVDHKIEWLQPDPKTGEIKSLSEFKKVYSPPQVSETDKFSGMDVLKCADMLHRASQKIDLRTGGAYVKFNIEQGRLEPLLIGIADKMGYKIKKLDNETVRKMEQSGRNVSHSIYLKS